MNHRVRVRHVLSALLLAVASLATGAEGEKTVPSAKDKETTPGVELSPQSAKYIEVATVAPATNQLWGRRIPARVSLQIAAHANVGAVVEGRVEQVLVRPGDVVETGQPLLKIHSAGGGQARAEAEQAKARLEAAEESLRRYNAMAAKGVATELEKYEAELHVREAKIDVERTRGANSLLGTGNGVEFFITAPTNGVVLSIGAVSGSALQPGNDIVEIGDPSKVWIDAEVSEDEASQIARGEAGLVELPRGGKNIPAKVESVAAQVDPVTRRRHIYLIPENTTPGALTPGMLVDVRLAEPGDQLTLPVEAVLIKGDQRVVYVQAPNGRLLPREVVVNTPADGRVRVLKGLKAGERVVVKGALLVDGRSEQLL